MSLNLLQLEAFQAVMREGTVTAAARSLHRTQSVVSRLIGDLESRLQIGLFRREKQRLIPTEAGLAFYRETERAFAALNEIEEAAHRLRDGRALPLRLLAPSQIIHGLLPPALAAFEAEHPQFPFILEVRQRDYVSHWLRNRQFDLAIAPGWEEAPGVVAEPLLDVPLYAAMHRDHPMAHLGLFTIADLAQCPLVMVRPGMTMRRVLDQAFAQAGVMPTLRGETASSLSAGQLAVHGLGATLVDPFVGFMLESSPHAVFRRTEPALKLTYHVLRPAGDALDAPKLFLLREMLRIALERIEAMERLADLAKSMG